MNGNLAYRTERTTTNTSLTDFRQSLSDFLEQVMKGQIISVATGGGNAIVLSEEEYRGLLETLRLLSIPGMREKLVAGMETPVEECDDFAW